MSEDPIKTVKISDVKSLEEYIFNLGLLSMSIETLYALQERAESIGIFSTDEEEQSKTVKLQVQRLYTCVDDLLNTCAKRTPLHWEGLMKEVIESARIKDRKKTGKNK